MVRNLPELAGVVQRNCDISDARHAGDYGLCTFLLKMREYYRWEHELPFARSLPKDELGDWLRTREQAWDRIDLILKIFQKHASTREARLEIELASIKHIGPRIFGMGMQQVQPQLVRPPVLVRSAAARPVKRTLGFGSHGVLRFAPMAQRLLMECDNEVDCSN